MEQEDRESQFDSFVVSTLDTQVVALSTFVVSELIQTGTVANAEVPHVPDPVCDRAETPASMKKLFNELRMRFAEFIEAAVFPETLEEFPSIAMSDLVDWLDSKGRDGFDSALIQRVVDLANWCESQPRGENAADDIYTVLVVSFYESLFCREHARRLLPWLMSKSRLEDDRSYFIAWVGEECYDKALREFTREGTEEDEKSNFHLTIMQ
jgi:hypothetical protein